MGSPIDLRRLLSEVIPKSEAIIGYEVTGEFPTLDRALCRSARGG
jgi:hypothetical protein